MGKGMGEQNDLQLRSGDVTPSLALCEEEVQNFALDKMDVATG